MKTGEFLKRRIFSWWWGLRYGDERDIVWFDDLVDMETGKQSINVYHIVGSIKKASVGSDRLGIKTMTREEAENMGGRPCEECFKIVLPKKEVKNEGVKRK